MTNSLSLSDIPYILGIIRVIQEPKDISRKTKPIPQSCQTEEDC